MRSVVFLGLNAIRLRLSSKATPSWFLQYLLRLWLVLKRNLRKLWRRGKRSRDIRGADDTKADASTTSTFQLVDSAPPRPVTICASRVPNIELVAPSPKSTMDSSYLSPYGGSARLGASRSTPAIGFTYLGAADDGPRLGLTLTRIPSQTSTPHSSRASLRVPSPALSRVPSPEQDPNRSSVTLARPVSRFGSRVSLAGEPPQSTPSIVFNVANPSGNSASPVRIKLKEMSSSGVLRYERRKFIKKRNGENVNIDRMTRSFNIPCPPEWTACTHPEGALYFFHERKKLLTDSNLYDVDNFNVVDAAARHVDNLIRRDNIEMPVDGYECVLEVLPSDCDDTCEDELVCGYYFADPVTHTLFWFDAYDTASLLAEVDGETSLPHMRHEIESRYWYHCELFPCHRDVGTELYQELTGILVHASIDSMTSSTSTSPYSHEETQKMLSLIKSVRDVGQRDGYSACVVSRLMSIFAHSRFLHYYGMPEARLQRDQSVYGHAEHIRSWIIKLFTPILFNAPEAHLLSLEKIWVDQVVNSHSWNELMKQMQEDWSNLSLTTTVMLTVNVSFLAIPSVDSGDSHIRSAAQVASYFSTVSSVASIILGLLLIRRHRVISHDDADVAQRYLYSKNNPSRGLEMLAIMYSLPYALLMWAMVTFLVALSCVCFQFNTTMRATSLATRLPIGVAWLFFLGLVVWFSVIDWEGTTHSRLELIGDRISTFSTLFSRTSRISKDSKMLLSLKQIFSTRGSEDVSSDSV